jgi:hypothetical protein
MSIISIAGESEQKSSFYLKFKDMADEIKKFSKDLNFEISGEFNSYFIEYKMSGLYDNVSTIIKANRKLTNTITDLIPVKSAYQEITDIKIETSLENFNEFIIERKNFYRQILLLLTNRKSFTVNDKFIVHSKSKEMIDNLEKIKPELKQLSNLNLAKLEISKNGFMELKFYNLFKTKNDLINSLEKVFRIKNYVC